MPVEAISIEFAMRLLHQFPVLDVRSENEYAAGHMPGAINLPILNNEHRTQVGICYKQQGHHQAVNLGYQLVGPLFGKMTAKAAELFPAKKILLYCWRGGLRSQIMADQLSQAGFVVYRLAKGYKSYRQWALQQFKVHRNLVILGGATGSRKTERLHWLALQYQQIIDLEALACHRGSSFGHIGMPAQPTQEQFENELALLWHRAELHETLWIEDESRMIGRLCIPEGVYTLMREAKLMIVDVPEHKRMEYLLATYGKLDRQALAAATQRLHRRLGDQRCRQALQCLSEGDMANWLSTVLTYYDKAYQHGNSKRDSRTVQHMDEIAFETGTTASTPLQPVYLLLGSNTGNSRWMMEQASTQIAESIGKVIAASSWYSTAAWGHTQQPDFLNRVLMVGTDLLPEEVLKAALKIEKNLGRERTEKWAARTIDIDLLYFAGQVLNTPELVLPHPHLHLRKFTLQPLAEIAPMLNHPVLNKTTVQLLAECPDDLAVNLAG